MNGGTEWRFLLVEDNEVLAKQVTDAIPGFIDAPDTCQVICQPSFADALNLLSRERFDVLILDLKDDNISGIEEHDVSAGMAIYESLKQTRFSPVIFYTAHAHKVRDLVTSYIRVVEKSGGPEALKLEVRGVLATRLPMISRRIEEVQRAYMWDFVSTHWNEYDSMHEEADLACLLVRRLASSLLIEARKLASKASANSDSAVDADKIYPMEMYVSPPIRDTRQSGDLVQGIVNGVEGIWLVLTPSCDFELRHPLDFVLLACCVPLTEQTEYLSWKNQDANSESKLKELIRDHRNGLQPLRYKFLPGTFFLPDTVVDFQMLSTVTTKELDSMICKASLDSPFAEATLTRFSQYFGRLGAPDIDPQVVLNRILRTEKLHSPKKPVEQALPIAHKK
jgi:CheY-like chemotaxis protein